MNDKTTQKLSYGLFVVGASDHGRPVGCIVNTAMQQTVSPLYVSVTINKANYTHDVVKDTGLLTISILDESVPFDVFTRFGFQSGRDNDKWDGVEDMATAKNGTPYLTKYANSYLSGKVVDSVEYSTHTQFICEIDDAEILSDIPSVTYAYYFAHIKPAPKPDKKSGWVCKICGYVYEGDELPEDYICPLCKHPASDFEKIELDDEDDKPKKNKRTVRKLTDDLYYVGGSDFRLELFENAYPIPDGVSYNSYVLLDDKTVLFDTCDESVASTFFANVDAVLDGRKLDYVIVNHMEPDHAATLADLVLRYPDVKIVSTKQAFTFMGQFFDFDIAVRQVIVNEGDTLETGHHTLTFVKAPMVHWPEVMVTFDTTDGLLFSADAFGSFGAIQGALLTSEKTPDDRYWDEARRYYTNIVGKYGPQVMNVLKKASRLDIKMILPLHGLIFDSHIDELLDHYIHWATYEPEEKGVMIAVGTIYDGTMNAAQILANELAKRGVTNIRIYDASKTHPSYLLSDAFRYSHLVFASASYNAGLFTSMHTFLSELQEHNMQNRSVALIQNGTWAPSALKCMKELLAPLKNITYIESDLLIKSRLKDSEGLEAIADAIVKDMNEEKTEDVQDEKPKRKWRCKICGYEYEGDELPEDYVCPLCKHPASDFEEVTE